MFSYIQILTISIGVLFGLVIGLYFTIAKLYRIIYSVRKNLAVDIKPTAETIEYLTEQRDKHHWSHPKYRAYNDRLKQLGVS